MASGFLDEEQTSVSTSLYFRDSTRILYVLLALMNTLRLGILVLKFQVEVPLGFDLYRDLIYHIRYRNPLGFKFQINKEKFLV